MVGVIVDSPTPINSLGAAKVKKFLANPEIAVKALHKITPMPIILVLVYLSASVPTINPDTV